MFHPAMQTSANKTIRAVLCELSIFYETLLPCSISLGDYASYTLFHTANYSFYLFMGCKLGLKQ